MNAHACVCSFMVVFLFSTYEPSSAEIGSLFPKDSSIQDLFQQRGKRENTVWRRRHEENLFFVCKSQVWLESIKPLNSTGIRELTVQVTYKRFLQSFPRGLLNETDFTLGIVASGENKHIDSFNASGILNKTVNKVSSIKLVPVNYSEFHILIKPPDTNDCLVVYAVSIIYKFCKLKKVHDVACFPKTYAPRNGSAPLKVEGRCMYGPNKPVAYCNSEGEWLNETLSCHCAPGEVLIREECIELSSIIQDLQAVRLSNTQGMISWKQRNTSVHYRSICKKCISNKCSEDCSTVKMIETELSVAWRNSSNITGLKRGYDYMFTIVGIIDSINEKHHRNKTTKQVSLKALPENVKNLSFTSYNHDRVTLTWLPPSNIDGSNIFYEIACRVKCVDEPCPKDCGKLKFIPSRLNLPNTNVTITGFKNEGLQYVFIVLAKDRLDESSAARIEWNFVAINYTDFKRKISTISKSFNVVDVIIGVSVLIVAVIITIIGTRCYNKWKRRKHTHSFYVENPGHLMQCEVPLTDVTTHYVDPSNYDSIENVLRKFTTKINEKNLKTETIIGEGEFGVVWKGYLETEGGNHITVAVKSLRSGLSAKLRRDFLAEASVMGQFKDPNVISLHGVVVKKHTVKIVMEFMLNGSLDQYLVKNNGGLTTLQLLGMARGIASGMKYLSGRNFIHRDLAARNILVDENLACKVSDFGLTREICQTSNYETRGGKIPIRWTAPEVIKHRKSFIASDVWSYGVVLWEIMSSGQRPYWDWDNFQVLQEVETGYRLPAPPKCPKTVHSLMLQCWEKERANRPTFLHILNKLDEWIRSPETIHHSPATKAKRNTAELVECQSPLQEWLESIKMGKYISNFSEAGIDRFSQLVNLTEEDLADMGITLVGHRHKIHQSIPLVT